MRIHKSLASLLLIASAILAGCILTPVATTFTYRDIQGEFNQAVQADNQVAVQPFTGSVSTSLYEGVNEKLTDEYVASLDARLQPNAWLLRSVAEWRTGDFAEAENSAQKGLDHPNLSESSRDQVALLMIPALVSESFVGKQLRQAPEEISPDDYDETFAGDLNRASKALGMARNAMAEATPVDVQYYFEFQVWRLLQNWNIIIGKISGEAEQRNEIREAALQQLRTDGLIGEEDQSMAKAAGSVEERIPTSHPLNALIQVLSQQ